MPAFDDAGVTAAERRYEVFTEWSIYDGSMTFGAALGQGRGADLLASMQPVPIVAACCYQRR
jgi:hypothetical protein